MKKEFLTSSILAVSCSSTLSLSSTDNLSIALGCHRLQRCCVFSFCRNEYAEHLSPGSWQDFWPKQTDDGRIDLRGGVRESLLALFSVPWM